jgi:hypothetical protein
MGEFRSTFGTWWRKVTAPRRLASLPRGRPMRCAWCEEWISVVKPGAYTELVHVSHGLCSRCHERLTESLRRRGFVLSTPVDPRERGPVPL